MKLSIAIERAQRFVNDCTVSPSHLMPRPTIEERDAIARLIEHAKIERGIAPIRDPLDHPDYSGCA